MSTIPPPVAAATPPAKKSSNTAALLIVLVIAVGLFAAWNWFVNDQKEKQRLQAEQVAASSRAYKAREFEQLKEHAMLLGIAMAGMSKYEVLKSMGHPDATVKTSQVDDESKKNALMSRGVFETLYYQQKRQAVELDVNGTVLAMNPYE